MITKKLLILFVVALLLTAGCVDTATQKSAATNEFDQLAKSSLGDLPAEEAAKPFDKKELKQEAGQEDEKIEEKKEMTLFGPIPEKVVGARYYRAPKPDSDILVGQAKIRFMNKRTNLPIPGFVIDCSACLDVYSLDGKDDRGFKKLIRYYPETDLDGYAILNLTRAEDVKVYAGQSSHWFEVYFNNDIKIEETKEIYLEPHIVGEGQTLAFPTVKYEVIDPQKTEVRVVLKDSQGRAVTGKNLVFSGAIKDRAKVMVVKSVDNNGVALADMPIPGSYRFRILTQVAPGTEGFVQNEDFHQFSVPTGYRANISLIIN